MMKLVDIKEIASMLSVKPSTLYQWAELGHIPCLKLNGCLRFDIDDVTAWLKSCKKGTVYENILHAETVARPRKGGQ